MKIPRASYVVSSINSSGLLCGGSGMSWYGLISPVLDCHWQCRCGRRFAAEGGVRWDYRRFGAGQDCPGAGVSDEALSWALDGVLSDSPGRHPAADDDGFFGRRQARCSSTPRLPSEHRPDRVERESQAAEVLAN